VVVVVVVRVVVVVVRVRHLLFWTRRVGAQSKRGPPLTDATG
jgi:hypothetical protein